MNDSTFISFVLFFITSSIIFIFYKLIERVILILLVENKIEYEEGYSFLKYSSRQFSSRLVD